VVRIRDILIRIRIVGSVHWITDPDPAPDPALFVNDFQDANKTKKIFLKFCLLHTVGSTFTPVFKDNKSLKSHKTVEIKVFLYFLLVDGRTRIRYKLLRIRDAQKFTDPVSEH
jgi:hypothetical protein